MAALPGELQQLHVRSARARGSVCVSRAGRCVRAAVSEARRSRLSFSRMSLERNWDYVRIYSVNTSNNSAVRAACKLVVMCPKPEVSAPCVAQLLVATDVGLPAPMVITGCVTVVFTSDQSVVFNGFSLSFDSGTTAPTEAPTAAPTPPGQECAPPSGTLSAASGTIVSNQPGFAYRDNASCSWTVCNPYGAFGVRSGSPAAANGALTSAPA